MKTIKKFTLSTVAILVTASSASALTTFGGATTIAPGSYTRPILLDGANAGTLAYNIAGSGADWAVGANYSSATVSSDNILNFNHTNNVNGSAQPFLTQFTITLNSGISLDGPMTIGAGGTALIGQGNGIFVGFTIDQPGTLALAQPASWSIAPGAIAASTTFQNTTSLAGTGTFGQWSLEFAPTTSFQYNHQSVINNPAASVDTEGFAIRFNVVPEPSSMMLSALGALGLLARRRRN